jgi:Leucine-rich repeat (LRR) protein
LRLIDLFENSLSQEIPPELGHLSRLKYLYLNKNLLGGEIPTNISFCSNLIEIDVGWNVLVGKIPVEFGSLPKLELLFIHANNLTGGIPLTFLSRNFLRPQIILVAVSPMLLANWKISHILHSMVIGCQVQSLLRSSISLLSEINPCQTINLKALLP